MAGNDADQKAKSEDYLGYSTYAQTLWARIERALDKDALSLKTSQKSELGDDPLVVGIFGEWGAGKSKLLQLIERHAVSEAGKRAGYRKQDGGHFTLTVPVAFQPWKYEHEKHLHVPLLMHILTELNRWAKDSQTFFEATQEAMPEAIKKHMDLVVNIFAAILTGTAYATDVNIGISEKFKLACAKILSTALKKSKPAEPPSRPEDFEFSENGHYFYDLNQILKAITRPEAYSKYLSDVKLSTKVTINFVIFIDDLDRCLPEKAVETLELIKTVFNLESFAFVLALDEEVVERGIGHRYRDYSFEGKKPEMPITGFEYLEKIVHLPFRLPALSKQQAYDFLLRYENDALLPAYQSEQYSPTAWMGSKASSVRPELVEGKHGFRGFHSEQMQETATESKIVGSYQFSLARLIVDSFDTYVPRKLIRVLELFHQCLRVLHEHKRIDEVRLEGALDPRLLMGLILLQLFQPELYRALRRTRGGFDQFLLAFSEPDAQLKKDFPAIARFGADISDADILYWAVYWQGAEPPVDAKEAAQRIAKLTYTLRYPAQRVRLPIAERLLEHRSIQRHAFDPLALMQALQQSHEMLALSSRISLFAVLSQVLDKETALPEAALIFKPAAAPPAPALKRHSSAASPSDVNALFLNLVAPELNTQKNAAEHAGLQAGQCLENDSASRLLDACKTQFLSENVQGRGSLEERKKHLLRGLQYLAPFIPPAYAQSFWDLVKPADDYKIYGQEHASLEQLQERERYADVQSSLGLDQRFNPALFYLPHQQADEPIAGFVYVPKSEKIFQTFQGEGFDLDPFYIARYATTVDQYAAFIEAKGYEKQEFWDDIGWRWRTGKWDSEIKEKAYKEHLARRKPELRHEPMNWADQRAFSSRPVTQINWFEARAYTRWLGAQKEFAQLLSGLKGVETKKFTPQLPTEAQWERASRSENETAWDDRQYPWSKTLGEENVHLRANIDDSKFERVTAVGLFEPSPLGLADLSGNAWEWQNNFWSKDGKTQSAAQTQFLSQVKTHQDWDKCERPALRGGSWIDSAGGARAPSRGRYRPDVWNYYVGFRVVLSLAS